MREKCILTRVCITGCCCLPVLATSYQCLHGQWCGLAACDGEPPHEEAVHLMIDERSHKICSVPTGSFRGGGPSLANKMACVMQA